MTRITGARRNSNRAEGFDYSLPGSYYVTVCTHRLIPMFGDVIDGEMHLNAFGRIVEEEWNRIAATESGIELDAFVVMPNHFHGIIVIHEAEHLVRAMPCVALGPERPACRPQASFNETAGAAAPRATHGIARTTAEGGPSARPLGVLVGRIKSASARRINGLRNTPGAPVWHRNFYDHIIRDERDMDRVRAYVMDNPTNWQYDRANRKETLAL